MSDKSKRNWELKKMRFSPLHAAMCIWPLSLQVKRRENQVVPKTNSWRRNTSRNDCQWTQFTTPPIPGAQLHSRRVRCWTGLPAVLIFHQWKHLEHHETRSRTKKSQDCWAAKTLHQTRMEQHPTPKKSKSCCPQFTDIYRKMLKGEAVQEHYKITLLMCVWLSVFERIWDLKIIGFCFCLF